MKPNETDPIGGPNLCKFENIGGGHFVIETPAITKRTVGQTCHFRGRHPAAAATAAATASTPAAAEALSAVSSDRSKRRRLDPAQVLDKRCNSANCSGKCTILLCDLNTTLPSVAGITGHKHVSWSEDATYRERQSVAAGLLQQLGLAASSTFLGDPERLHPSKYHGRVCRVGVREVFGGRVRGRVRRARVCRCVCVCVWGGGGGRARVCARECARAFSRVRVRVCARVRVRGLCVCVRARQRGRARLRAWLRVCVCARAPARRWWWPRRCA